jgi:hypothetical protein
LLAIASGGAAASGWWTPPQALTWYWQLQGKVKNYEPVAAFDIDGFDNSAAEVAALHAEGKHVICYLSVGTAENWRADYSSFPESVLGNPDEGWPGERWIDIRQIGVVGPIMEKRFQMCHEKGFDAVEPDNINGWENKSGFPLTRADQLRFNRWIARQVHKRGMAVALKNDSRQVRQLVGSFDFAVVEECFQYEECDLFEPFVEAGKAVFEAEYELPTAKFCAQAEALGFAAIRKDVELFPQPWEPCHPAG